ncbi:MAG TPA: hypothetical protein VNL96_02730 [Gemmatimonadaceae bacterium]|nr:hypothetical protein [Gemmatimonadaceae bacterium]
MEELPLEVVVLGNDALLAARPASPLQLERAVRRAGYDLVVPASWGEEAVAARVGAVARERMVPVVPAHCPFVAECLRKVPGMQDRCLEGVSPPVAAARLVRLVLQGRAVSLTYVGACPGAALGGYDHLFAPDVFVAWLRDTGLAPERQLPYLDNVLPSNRSRFCSLPGGIPAPTWLQDQGLELREAAPVTVLVALQSGRPGIIDLEPACGWACARQRDLLSSLEPPPSTEPIVSPGLDLQLEDGAAVRCTGGPATDPASGATARASTYDR